MSKLWALFDLFRKGSVVTDPALWKQRQITATVLLPLLASLVAASKAFGYDLPLTDADLAQLVGGLVVVINLVLTLATSDKVGLPPRRAPDRSQGLVDGPGDGGG